MPFETVFHPYAIRRHARAQKRIADLREYIAAHPGSGGAEHRTSLGLTVNEWKFAIQRTTGIRREGGHGRSFGRYYAT